MERERGNYLCGSLSDLERLEGYRVSLYKDIGYTAERSFCRRSVTQPTAPYRIVYIISSNRKKNTCTHYPIILCPAYISNSFLHPLHKEEKKNTRKGKGNKVVVTRKEVV